MCRKSASGAVFLDFLGVETIGEGEVSSRIAGEKDHVVKVVNRVVFAGQDAGCELVTELLFLVLWSYLLTCRVNSDRMQATARAQLYRLDLLESTLLWWKHI